MITRPYRVRVCREANGAFLKVRDANVLIHCPHGFGDWIFLAHVLPLLHPSNRYFITRHGDHNVSVLDGCTAAVPCYLGCNPIGSDGLAGLQWPFGMWGGCDGFAEAELELPAALHEQCKRHGIGVVLDLEFLEPDGFQPFPWHTKARFLASKLVDGERMKEFDFGKPLGNCISFSVPDFVTQWVESRLRSLAGWEGRKLCVIARNGYTSTGKNWGHLWREDMPENERREGEECRQFMRLMLRHDPEWMFVAMEDRIFEGDDTVRSKADRCWSYAELFGDAATCAMPFGLAVKALLNCAELAVGVPTGPFHLAMAKSGLPTVGLWLQHFPSWTDEPREDSVHLLGRNLVDSGIISRPGSFTNRAGLFYKTHQLSTRIIPAEAVFAAAGEVLGWPTSRIMPTFLTPASRKMIAVTIGTGTNGTSHVEAAAQSCRSWTGLEVFILREEAVSRYGVPEAGHLKFKVFEEFPEVEAVLIFDSDTQFLRGFDPIPFSDCRSVVGLAGQANEIKRGNGARHNGAGGNEVFSSRFLILNRKHHCELLKEAERIAGKGRRRQSDQAALNAARVELNIPFYPLGWQFDPDAGARGGESHRKVLQAMPRVAAKRKRKLAGAK